MLQCFQLMVVKRTLWITGIGRIFHLLTELAQHKKPVTTMLTYPWKCTVLHCNHLGNTWKPLVLMTRHFDYCPSASEWPCKPMGLGHDVISHYVFCIWNGIVTIIKVAKYIHHLLLSNVHYTTMYHNGLVARCIQNTITKAKSVEINELMSIFYLLVGRLLQAVNFKKSQAISESEQKFWGEAT